MVRRKFVVVCKCLGARTLFIDKCSALGVSWILPGMGCSWLELTRIRDGPLELSIWGEGGEVGDGGSHVKQIDLKLNSYTV